MLEYAGYLYGLVCFVPVMILIAFLLGWINHYQKEVGQPFRVLWIHMLNARRFSEFHDLRKKLLLTFPNAGAAMPPLPPKSMICG